MAVAGILERGAKEHDNAGSGLAWLAPRLRTRGDYLGGCCVEEPGGDNAGG